jgi:predicted O-methyltransferase YrrM
LLFVDARKSEYWEYVRYFESMMASQGVIICDDVIKFRHKMHWLYEYVDKMQIKVEILPLDEDDGVMIISRK